MKVFLKTLWLQAQGVTEILWLQVVSSLGFTVNIVDRIFCNI